MKLYYFDIYGKGEQIRMLLSHAKVAFEDVRLTEESFKELKTSGTPHLEFGQLPALEVDGKFYFQTQAIVRMLGKKYGYYPEDAQLAYQVDSVIDSNADLAQHMFKIKAITDDEEKLDAVTAFLKGYMTTWLTAHEARLVAQGHNNFLVGDKMTTADFNMASLINSTFYNEASEASKLIKEILDVYPHFKGYTENVNKHLADYLAARPSPRPF